MPASLHDSAPIARIVVAWAALVALSLIPVIRDSWSVFNTTPGVKALVGLYEATFILAIVTRWQVQLPRGLSWLCGAWLVWASAAVIASDHPTVALVRHAEWLCHGMFAYALFVFAGNYATVVRNVIRCVLGGFVLYFIEFAIFRITLPWLDGFTWATGLPGFSNVRHLGYYATVCLPLSLYLVHTESRDPPAARHFDQALGAAAMTLAWFFLFWAGGRGPAIALVLAALVIVASRVRPQATRAMLWVPVTVFPALGLAHLLAVPDFGFWRIAGLLGHEGGIAALSLGRVVLWTEAMEYVAASPWFGLGPDGYLYEQSVIRLQLVQPHSLILQAALEWGLPGMAIAGICIGGLLAWLFVPPKTRVAVPVSRPPSICSRYAALGWAIFAVLALALIDGPLYHAQSSMLFAACLGIAAAGKVGTALVRRAAAPWLTGLAALSALTFCFHTLSVSQAIDVNENDIGGRYVLQRFPSGMTDHRAAFATSRRLLTCLESSRDDCAALARFAVSHLRPQAAEPFAEQVMLLQSGKLSTATERLKGMHP